MECIHKGNNFLRDSKILQDLYHYPKGAAFCIENFKGNTDKVKEATNNGDF